MSAWGGLIRTMINYIASALSCHVAPIWLLRTRRHSIGGLVGWYAAKISSMTPLPRAIITVGLTLDRKAIAMLMLSAMYFYQQKKSARRDAASAMGKRRLSAYECLILLEGAAVIMMYIDCAITHHRPLLAGDDISLCFLPDQDSAMRCSMRHGSIRGWRLLAARFAADYCTAITNCPCLAISRQLQRRPYLFLKRDAGVSSRMKRAAHYVVLDISNGSVLAVSINRLDQIIS